MTNRKFLSLTAAALGGVLVAFSALSATYGTLVPEQSRIGFVSRQMGVPVSGGFRRFDGRVAFDPARPETASARIEVDLASIDAGSREANDEVVGKDWFHTQSFPTAVFEGRRVKALGPGRYEVLGRLTIKGRTQDVAAGVTFRESGGNGVFEGGFTLKRLIFGVGEGAWGDPETVADEVQINWTITLKPIPQPRK
jgi:polyisoprenoid-binding protein YceI